MSATSLGVAPSGERSLRGEGLVWLIGAVVCLHSFSRGSNNCQLARTMDGRIALQHH